MIMVMAKRASKRILLVLIISVLLVAALAGGYYVYRTYMAPKPAESPTQTTATTNENVVQAPNALASQISQSSDDKKKADLYIQLAQSQAFSGDYKDAAESAKQATALSPTSDNYATAASYYVKIDDKTTAITYFKKALELVPKSTDPTENSPYNTYAANIIELGGSV